MRVVIVEDRPTHLVGAKLALLSLREHSPTLPIAMHASDPAFAGWCERHVGVQVEPVPVRDLTGWDVKPGVLLHHLEAGEPELAWFDSDLICTRDLIPVLAGVPADHVVGTEEMPLGQHRGGSHRAVAWGLEPGRELPTTVNTAFLRVSRSHMDLLTVWRELLNRREYREAQQRPWNERPMHLVGDQEVLTALLGSKVFAGVPLHLLRQGVEIAQCSGPAGYAPGSRIRRALAGEVPPLIHAMGRKPWEAEGRSGPRGLYERRHAAQSPYTRASRRYTGALDEPAEWLGGPGGGGAASVNLAELPLAMVDHVVRRSRAALGIARFGVEGREG